MHTHTQLSLNILDNNTIFAGGVFCIQNLRNSDRKVESAATNQQSLLSKFLSHTLTKTKFEARLCILQ